MTPALDMVVPADLFFFCVAGLAHVAVLGDEEKGFCGDFRASCGYIGTDCLFASCQVSALHPLDSQKGFRSVPHECVWPGVHPANVTWISVFPASWVSLSDDFCLQRGALRL